MARRAVPRCNQNNQEFVEIKMCSSHTHNRVDLRRNNKQTKIPLLTHKSISTRFKDNSDYHPSIILLYLAGSAVACRIPLEPTCQNFLAHCVNKVKSLTLPTTTAHLDLQNHCTHLYPHHRIISGSMYLRQIRLQKCA